MEFEITIVLIFVFLIGIVLGTLITDHRWIANAKSPIRLLTYGKFFKVVELSNKESWNLLDIHQNHQKQEEKQDWHNL